MFRFKWLMSLGVLRRLMPFCPMFPAFFGLQISLGQQVFITLQLKSGEPSLGPRRVIPYSLIKLLEFSFQSIRRHYSRS